jgi:hypothetical protein
MSVGWNYPEVNKVRARLAAAVRLGRHDDEVRLRAELQRAVLQARISSAEADAARWRAELAELDGAVA